MWSENEEESTDQEKSEDLLPIMPFEVNEGEVKEGKGLKILTLNKLLTTLPILLAQIKAGNDSYKLINEIRQISCFVSA